MLRYLVLVVFVPACTLGRLGDRDCTTTKRGNFPLLTTPDSLQWSIVDFREIGNYCSRDEFTYNGSYMDYHLIIWSNDDPSYAGVEHYFAVLKGAFSPAKPFEYNGRGGLLTNGGLQRVFP